MALLTLTVVVWWVDWMVWMVVLTTIKWLLICLIHHMVIGLV